MAVTGGSIFSPITYTGGPATTTGTNGSGSSNTTQTSGQTTSDQYTGAFANLPQYLIDLLKGIDSPTPGTATQDAVTKAQNATNPNYLANQNQYAQNASNASQNNTAYNQLMQQLQGNITNQWNSAAYDANKNPFDAAVTQSTLGEYDQKAAESAAALAAKNAASGAFGTKTGLVTQQQAQQSDQDRAALDAQLKAAGYDKAVAQFNTGNAAQLSAITQGLGADNSNKNTMIAGANAAANISQNALTSYMSALSAQQGLSTAQLQEQLAAAGFDLNKVTSGNALLNSGTKTESTAGQQQTGQKSNSSSSSSGSTQQPDYPSMLEDIIDKANGGAPATGNPSGFPGVVPAGSTKNSDGTYTGSDGKKYDKDGKLITTPGTTTPPVTTTPGTTTPGTGTGTTPTRPSGVPSNYVYDPGSKTWQDPSGTGPTYNEGGQDTGNSTTPPAPTDPATGLPTGVPAGSTKNPDATYTAPDGTLYGQDGKPVFQIPGTGGGTTTPPVTTEPTRPSYVPEGAIWNGEQWVDQNNKPYTEPNAYTGAVDPRYLDSYNTSAQQLFNASPGGFTLNGDLTGYWNLGNGVGVWMGAGDNNSVVVGSGTTKTRYSIDNNGQLFVSPENDPDKKVAVTNAGLSNLIKQMSSSYKAEKDSYTWDAATRTWKKKSGMAKGGTYKAGGTIDIGRVHGRLDESKITPEQEDQHIQMALDMLTSVMDEDDAIALLQEKMADGKSAITAAREIMDETGEASMARDAIPAMATGGVFSTNPQDFYNQLLMNPTAIASASVPRDLQLENARKAALVDAEVAPSIFTSPDSTISGSPFDQLESFQPTELYSPRFGSAGDNPIKSIGNDLYTGAGLTNVRNMEAMNDGLDWIKQSTIAPDLPNYDSDAYLSRYLGEGQTAGGLRTALNVAANLGGGSSANWYSSIGKGILGEDARNRSLADANYDRQVGQQAHLLKASYANNAATSNNNAQLDDAIRRSTYYNPEIADILQSSPVIGSTSSRGGKNAGLGFAPSAESVTTSPEGWAVINGLTMFGVTPGDYAKLTPAQRASYGTRAGIADSKSKKAGETDDEGAFPTVDSRSKGVAYNLIEKLGPQDLAYNADPDSLQGEVKDVYNKINAGAHPILSMTSDVYNNNKGSSSPEVQTTKGILSAAAAKNVSAGLQALKPASNVDLIYQAALHSGAGRGKEEGRRFVASNDHYGRVINMAENAYKEAVADAAAKGMQAPTKESITNPILDQYSLAPESSKSPYAGMSKPVTKAEVQNQLKTLNERLSPEIYQRVSKAVNNVSTGKFSDSDYLLLNRYLGLGAPLALLGD